MGGYQYKNGELQFFPTAEGYVRNTQGVLNYIFQYRDHLGNIRLSYAENPAAPGTASMIEENHYYPFGLKHANYNSDQMEFAKGETGVFLKEKPCTLCPQPVMPLWNNYKYNGQEWQDELGLNMTAMDYRQYDNAIGRFNSIDALAEVQYSQTPYHFGYNNPVYWADPTGLLSDDFINSMWNNSARNATTTWTNQGGMFMNQNNSGMIDGNTGEFTAMVGLPQVDITVNRNNWQGTGAVAQMHTYKNSSFYDSFWKDVRTENMNGFQREMDGFGALDPTGVIDGLNAIIYAFRGQKANATIAMVGILPFGDLAKVGKYGSKVDNVATTAFREFSGTAKAVGEGVPNSVYNYTGKDGTLVSKYFYNDAGKVNFQIDFHKQKSWLPGHGHNMTIPGSLQSGHLPDNHVPLMLVPKKYW